jgi:hypothetical protein
METKTTVKPTLAKNLLQFNSAFIDLLILQLTLGMNGRYRVVPKLVLRAENVDSFYYTKDFAVNDNHLQFNPSKMHLIPLSKSQKRQLDKGRLPGCFGPWCDVKRGKLAQLPCSCRRDLVAEECNRELAESKRWGIYITKRFSDRKYNRESKQVVGSREKKGESKKSTSGLRIINRSATSTAPSTTSSSVFSSVPSSVRPSLQSSSGLSIQKRFRTLADPKPAKTIEKKARQTT